MSQLRSEGVENGNGGERSLLVYGECGDPFSYCDNDCFGMCGLKCWCLDFVCDHLGGDECGCWNGCYKHDMICCHDGYTSYCCVNFFWITCDGSGSC